jgi:hypothetical protein
MKTPRVFRSFTAAALLLSSVVGSVGVLVGTESIAHAQGAAAAKPTGGGAKDEGYGYEFSDDPLAAGGFGPGDATIRVRPGPVRTTLIRPRTSFVTEMLKSVENL